MRIIDKKATLDYMNAPDPEFLQSWCRENSYEGVNPAHDIQDEKMPSDHVLAAALYYARQNHPDANNLDICSYAGFVAYLATGWYGGFGTDCYEKERRAENICLALAGGEAGDEGFWFMPKSAFKDVPSKEFTRQVLSFLGKYYFQDENKAVIEIATQNALALIRSGAVLTVTQTAKIYGLTTRNIRMAITQGKFKPTDVANTSAGWLISKTAADQLWGNREE